MTKIDPILLNDWYIVAKAEDIQQGEIKSVRLLGEDIVVWRGNSPESPVLAWQDWCPHRGAALSRGKIVSDCLACGYHGLRYDKTGKCVYIPSLPTQTPPANARVKAYKCQESRDYIWVSLGNPVQNILPIPEYNNPDYCRFISRPYYIRSSPFRVLENNFDLAHVPFVHEGSIGDARYPAIEEYEVETDKDGITIRNFKLWQMSPVFIDNKNVSKFSFSMRINRPLSILGVKETENDSKKKYWFVHVTPVEEESCLLWVEQTLNYFYELPELEMQKHQDIVFREDTQILESQRPARLPLLSRNNSNTQWPREVNVQCDKASVAYRKWLKDLGITFGVC